MLDRVFRGAAAGADSGLMFEKFGVTRGPEHFIDRGRNMVIGQIVGMGPADAIFGLRVRIVRQVSREALEGLAAGSARGFGDQPGFDLCGAGAAQ